MAKVPTTTTCCTIREMLRPVRKRSLCKAKKIHAMSRAISGLTTGWAKKFSTRRKVEGWFIRSPLTTLLT